MYGGQKKKFLFNAPGNISGYPVNIRIGFINQLFMHSYNIEIFLNNERSSVYSFPAREKGNIDITSYRKPKTDNNIINISLSNSSSTDYIHLDWIEVEYERELSLINNNLVFFKTGENVYGSTKFTISNIYSSDIEIYDTTDPFNVMRNTYSQYDSQNNTLTFQETIPVNQTSRFSMWKAGSFLKVSSISKKRRTNLRNANNEANYFIITSPMFYEEAIRLAEWRLNDSQIDPLLPMVVNVEDIYDEFNWGVFDPISVRDFLKFVWENGDPNQKYYCCFFGDTITKYKNLSDTQKERVFVTTYTDLNYSSDDRLYVTDDFFSWFDNNRIPAFAIGRLCANDKDTASNLVDKIIEYERNSEPGMWHNRVLFIADDELGQTGIVNEVMHTRNSEKLLESKYIPSYLERQKIYQIEYPLKNFRKPDVTEAVISAFHEGYIIANFIGHGNSDVLAHEHIIEGARDIDRFNNRDRLPLFFIASCSVAKFYMLDNLSLGEFFHLRKNGGCIGVIAAIGNTYSSNNQSLNKSLKENSQQQHLHDVLHIFQPHFFLGNLLT